MTEYKVVVEKIVRSYTALYIEAESEDHATVMAMNLPLCEVEGWSVIDDSYTIKSMTIIPENNRPRILKEV